METALQQFNRVLQENNLRISPIILNVRSFRKGDA